MLQGCQFISRKFQGGKERVLGLVTRINKIVCFIVVSVVYIIQVYFYGKYLIRIRMPNLRL